MISVRALGILTNDPQRVEVALGVLQKFLTTPASADGYGIATFVDDAVVLKRVPGIFSGKDLSDLATGLQGSMTLMQVRAPEELRPRLYPSSGTNLGPFRLRQFAAMVLGGPQNADEASSSQERLLKGIPEFLQHGVLGQTENEAFFVRLVAECYQKIGTDIRCLSPGQIIDTISNLLEKLESKYPRFIAFTYGQEIVYFSQGMQSAVITIKGLPLESAHQPSISFADSSTAKERLRQFRASILLGAMSGPWPKNEKLPEGMELISLEKNSKGVLQRNLTFLDWK